MISHWRVSCMFSQLWCRQCCVSSPPESSPLDVILPHFPNSNWNPGNNFHHQHRDVLFPTQSTITIIYSKGIYCSIFLLGGVQKWIQETSLYCHVFVFFQHCAHLKVNLNCFIINVSCKLTYMKKNHEEMKCFIFLKF